MIKNFEIHYRKWSFEQKERTLTEEARIWVLIPLKQLQTWDTGSDGPGYNCSNPI